MQKISDELDNEIFDPTGQGVEVVDAEFARKLASDRDRFKEECARFRAECAAQGDLISRLQGELLKMRSEKGVETRASQLEALSEFDLISEFGKYLGHGLTGRLAASLVSEREINNPTSKSLSNKKLKPVPRDTAEENVRLREIFPKILEALGNDEVCGSGAAVVFLENIPAIVKSEVEKLKALPENDLSRDLVQEFESHSALMLSQVASVVSDYCESEDCTTLDAVRLMICRIKELEAAMTRREIRDSWGN
jgi:hypothetical protein